MNSEQLAIELGNDEVRLLKRLLDARKVLAVWARPYFKSFYYDFKNKRFIGKDNLVLQWRIRKNPELPISYENQQTNRGTVSVERIEE